MNVAAPRHGPKEFTFEWEGKDRNGQAVRGQMRGAGENQVRTCLRRQGVQPLRIRKRRALSWHRDKPIKPKDIALFTRQLATMLKAGVALLQAFDIVVQGDANPALNRLLREIRRDVESGTALSSALRKFPANFDTLYCNLVQAGETAGILEDLLDRLATDMEKMLTLKRKIKSALSYPAAVLAVTFAVVAMLMIFVVPSFKQVFLSVGADLPAPTLAVIAMSEFFVAYGWLALTMLGGLVYAFVQMRRRRPQVRAAADRLLLKLPVFGALIGKSCVARWTRTLSALFAAGVPLVEGLDCAGGAAGNSVYATATASIRQAVATGTSLTHAMTNTGVFPAMVLQMTAIGEESGALDRMLGKVADFHEQEIDSMAAGLSSLMEPIIIVLLGVVIGGIVVAMYLPIFKLGQVI
ncbi:MAG: type II secretion system F family protein [Burkholderiaceae bacterium]|jgi:type IV pilus assembly protein PilC|nr:type II secretion system F family protein [Burkholderiaceae bacterium]